MSETMFEHVPVLDCLACPFLIRDPSALDRLRAWLHGLQTPHEIYDGPMAVNAGETDD